METGLRWGPIVAGAALAASIGFLGDLAGGFLILFDAGQAGGFTWFGGLVILGVLLAALFVGARVAAGLAGDLDRRDAVIHGLLVWALVALTAAAEFAALAAGPVVAAAGEGQLRLILGGAAVGLAAGAGVAVAGALSARPGPRAGLAPGRSRPAGPEAPYPPPAGAGTGRRPPTEPLPPGLH
jgi:hypothetical protein